MFSHQLAQALRTHGIHVASSSDGDDMEDGDLTVAANVHVQVPTFGEPPRVVVDAFHSSIRCYPPRVTVSELAQDIRDALNENPSSLGTSSIH